MRDDAKTTFTSTAFIALGIIIFELGKLRKILGSWDFSTILPLTFGKIGQFIGYASVMLLISFIFSALFIQRPSRPLSRKLLVISTAISAALLMTDETLALFRKFSIFELTAPPTGMMIAAAIYLYCLAIHGALKGFSWDNDTSPPKDDA